MTSKDNQRLGVITSTGKTHTHVMTSTGNYFKGNESSHECK